MAVSYKHLKCPGCDGTLQYIKDKKIWECIYCGNEVRREEEYDGLYTIKNVVKQVLIDLAYERLDSAQKNLVECEKIDSNYVGTLIATICYNVIHLITPGACQQSEMKSIFGRVKRLYEKLNENGKSISTEEEMLYEAFEENGDAFGVLLLVFDTLQAKEHFEFAESFFDPSNVYSRSVNANLLNFAIKNHKAEMVDKIFANSDNLDCRNALFILLEQYSDSDNKQTYIKDLIKKAEFKQGDDQVLNDYIEHSSDSPFTKIMLYITAIDYGIVPSFKKIVDHVLCNDDIDKEVITNVFSAFCKTKPKDAQLYDLIDVIYTKHSGTIAIQEMDELLSNDIFIKLSDKVVRNMIVRVDLSVEERMSLLDLAEKCRLDMKANDAIMAEILLKLEEHSNIRIAFIQKMLEYINTISTNTLTNYIINSTIDGECKVEILDIIFNLDLKMSFFGNVLDEYLKKSNDGPEVKNKVIQLLNSKGIAVKGDMILDIACAATDDDYMEKADMIRHSIQNGNRVNADFLSRYLELVHPHKYRLEFLTLLNTPASQISAKALANYVFGSLDSFEVKINNARAFASKTASVFGESMCEVIHLGHRIKCNLFQGYVLCAEDSPVVIAEMVNAMKVAKARLNLPMVIDGQSVKFKKYIVEHKHQLSAITLTLCEENNVFSLFF